MMQPQGGGRAAAGAGEDHAPVEHTLQSREREGKAPASEDTKAKQGAHQGVQATLPVTGSVEIMPVGQAWQKSRSPIPANMPAGQALHAASPVAPQRAVSPSVE